MHCTLLDQGMKPGKCLTSTGTGDLKKACEVTLQIENGNSKRLIKSIHLSRPEDYLSIYQSES